MSGFGGKADRASDHKMSAIDPKRTPTVCGAWNVEEFKTARKDKGPFDCGRPFNFSDH
jgi:hypothetical protein